MSIEVHDPTAVLRDALARMRERRAVHPHPTLVPLPRRWCTACRVHLASEAGGINQPALCVVCEGGPA